MGATILAIAFISTGALGVLWAISTAIQWWMDGDPLLAAMLIVSAIFAIGLIVCILEDGGAI